MSCYCYFWYGLDKVKFCCHGSALNSLNKGFVIFQKWQKFTIDQVIYAINGLRNSEKFTIARFFTIDGVTIARFDCTSLRNLSCNLANTVKSDLLLLF